MTRWMKILLGLGSHWFLAYLPLVIGLVFTVIPAAPKAGHGAPPPGFFLGIGCFILAHVFSVLAMLVTLGFSLAYAVKHPRFASNERLLWALLLAFAGAFAMPVFYWLHFHTHPIGEPFFGPKDPS